MTTDPIAAARAMIEPLTGYTSGPWSSFIDDTGGKWSGWPLSISPASDEDKTVVRPGGQWPYEWDAKTSQYEACQNARLIAAAPDLRDMIATLADALEAERDQALARAAAAAMEMRERAADYVQSHNQSGVNYNWSGMAETIRDLTIDPDAQAALDKLLAEALDAGEARADNLMRERDDALMRLGSITEHLARLAEAKDHADGEPETDFDRGYDQAGDEIATMIRDTEHNAQIILGEMLAEARLEGWRAGRDAALAKLNEHATSLRQSPGYPHKIAAAAFSGISEIIRELPEPKEASHDD